MSDTKEILKPRAAEARVAARDTAVLNELSFENRDDFVDADRGFIATIPNAEILGACGQADLEPGAIFLHRRRPGSGYGQPELVAHRPAQRATRPASNSSLMTR
jgi:hypothetical protein